MAFIFSLAGFNRRFLVVPSFRAVWGFCEHLKACQNEAVMTPMLPVITDALLNLAVLFSNEVLGLVMETLAMVLAVSCLSLFNHHTVP